MGGLWKLAAMSAVIGAGLVVVWQAQLGLQTPVDPGVPTAPSLQADVPSGDDPAADTHAAADSPTLLNNLTPPRVEPTSAEPTLIANASVPPEADAEPTLTVADDSDAEPALEPEPETPAEPKSEQNIVLAMAEVPATTPTLAPAPAALPSTPAAGTTPAVRYSRGLNFRELPTDQKPASGAEVKTAAANVTNPVPLKSAVTDEEPALLPVPSDADEIPALEPSSAGTVELTSGQQPPIRASVVRPAAAEADPFFDAAPPDMASPPQTLPKEPAGAGAAPLPLDGEADAFGPEPLPTPTAAPAARSAAPADSFDPFGESAAPPAAATPAPMNRAAPSATPAPAPTAEPDPFEPFPEDLPGSGKVPAATAPGTPAPRAAAPPALPVDLDNEPAPVTGAPAANAPAVPLEEDPFSGAAPPDMPAAAPAPRMTPAPTTLPEPAPAEPAPATIPDPAPVPERASPPATPEKGLFEGDGLVAADAPRGLQEPRLTIEKFAPASAVLGQPLVYSVVVKNVGGSPATQVTVEDRIPKGTRLVGTAPQAEMIEKRLVWRKIGTLQPGEERKISIKVIPEEEGPIGSVAKVSFISEVAAEIVVRAPKLKVTINSPTAAKVGENVPLVFLVTNPGNGDASNVILRCILPEGLEHPAGTDLEYTVGTLPANGSREVKLEVTATKSGRVSHQTIVTGDGNLTSEVRGTLNVQGEELLLTRSGHDRVYLGRNAVFTNSVVNEGQGPVADVSLTEGVPEGFDFVSASHGGTYDAAQRVVNWKLGSLPPAGSASVAVTLVAKNIGRFDTTVTAAGPNGSAASVRPTVAIEGYPALALERLGESRLVAVGESLTAKIQVQNRGTAPATGVAVTIDIPAEMKLVSATGPSSYRMEGQRLTFDPVSELDPNEATPYELVLEALAPGDNHLELQITADHLRRPVRHDEAVQVLPGTK